MSKYVNVYHTHRGGGIALYFCFVLSLPCSLKRKKKNIHIDRIFSNNMSIFKNIQLTKRIEVILRRKRELEALDLTSELKRTDEQVRNFVSSHTICVSSH